MAEKYRSYDEMPVEEKKKMHRYFLTACVLSPFGLLYLLFIEGYAQRGTHHILIGIAGFILAAVLGVFHYKRLKQLG